MRSRALVTIVRNESVFFPIWLRYYGQFFDADDIYVFDHGSTDGSTEVGGFNREIVTHDTVDHRWMRRTIQKKQNELMESYEVVLINDVDEIIVPNPETYGTLGDFMETFTDDFVNCTGFEVLHDRETEPPIDLERPILEQRGWWFPNFAYSKPLLAQVPMKWFDGFHARQDGVANFDHDIRLIHLHRMDFELCRERHRFRSGIAWSDDDLESQSGYQNRITEEERFAKWFYEDSCTIWDIDKQPIPEIWRSAV